MWFTSLVTSDWPNHRLSSSQGYDIQLPTNTVTKFAFDARFWGQILGRIDEQQYKYPNAVDETTNHPSTFRAVLQKK